MLRFHKQMEFPCEFKCGSPLVWAPPDEVFPVAEKVSAARGLSLKCRLSQHRTHCQDKQRQAFNRGTQRSTTSRCELKAKTLTFSFSSVRWTLSLMHFWYGAVTECISSSTVQFEGICPLLFMLVLQLTSEGRMLCFTPLHILNSCSWWSCYKTW